MKNLTIKGDTTPLAEIAINKSRLKKYNKKSNKPVYYLKNGQEFQIELFNPTQDKILAEIELNGKKIGNGIILRPAERVFLERFFDSDNKFLFETYEINNTESNRDSIELNGEVSIRFYKKFYPLTFRSNSYYDWWNNSGSGTIYLGNSNNTTIGNNFYNSSNLNVSNTNLNSDNFTLTGSLSSVNLDTSNKNSKKTKSIETGRIEKGSKSNQKFTTSDESFEAYSFKTINYKLLPISTKINDSKSIVKRYCTQCGSKIKGGYKFCPNCGAKL